MDGRRRKGGTKENAEKLRKPCQRGKSPHRERACRRPAVPLRRPPAREIPRRERLLVLREPRIPTEGRRNLSSLEGRNLPLEGGSFLLFARERGSDGKGRNAQAARPRPTRRISRAVEKEFSSRREMILVPSRIVSRAVGKTFPCARQTRVVRISPSPSCAPGPYSLAHRRGWRLGRRI